MKIAAKTDIGKVRKSNQDSYAAGEFPDGVSWAVVCDGMGGNAGGNIASSSAVKSISDQISSVYRENMTPVSIKNMLVTAVTNANYSIYDMSLANEKLRGMGTTVVAVIVSEHTVYIAHAGDSRAYIIKKDGMSQITKDHSVVQAMVEKGQLTQEEAQKHPRKNLITRALGVDEEIRVDFNEETMSDDDVLLICTDGLTNFVSKDEILNIAKNGIYYEYADKLVELANQNGGGDNITVVVIAY